MTGPIQGNYSPQQLQEMEQIWGNLPNASQPQINDDINKLKNLLASFPPDSSQAQALGYAVQNLQSASSGYDQGMFIVNAENAIAVTISPQLPSVMTQEMNTTLQQMLKNMGNASPSQLKDYLNSLTQMLVQAQGMPSSPQQMSTVYMLQQAIQGLTGYMGSGQGFWGAEFATSLQYLIGLPQGGEKGASSVG